MESDILANRLIASIPRFKELWAIEDIHREEDGSFNSYSLCSFLADFLRFEHDQITRHELMSIATMIEDIFIEDPDSKWTDGPSLKDAMIVNVLSMAAESQRGGESLKSYLGSRALPYWGRP